MTPAAAGGPGAAAKRRSDELWTAVDRYITDRLIGHDAALEGALEASAAAGLPPIAVSPPQGKLLWFLARLQQEPDAHVQKAEHVGSLGHVQLDLGIPGILR